MNWLDAVLVLILALSIFAGIRKGLSRQIVGLVAAIVAIVVGLWSYGLVGGILEPYLSSRRLANFLGFVVIFCGVMILGAIVGYLIHKFLKFTGLSFFDRVLGGGFGLLRGALIAAALVLGIMAFSAEGKPPQSVVQSRVAPYAVGAARIFASMAPHELREGFRKTYSEVKTIWSRSIEKELRETPRTDKKQNEKRI